MDSFLEFLLRAKLYVAYAAYAYDGCGHAFEEEQDRRTEGGGGGGDVYIYIYIYILRYNERSGTKGSRKKGNALLRARRGCGWFMGLERRGPMMTLNQMQVTDGPRHLGAVVFPK